jgi:signal transduction histidine kinase
MTGDPIKKFLGLNATSIKGTNDEKETGLELMICKGMVEQHGGTIFVKSDFGKGTDISFMLQKA